MDEDIFDSATPVPAISSRNLGRPTFMVTCRIPEFLERARTYNPKNTQDEDQQNIQGSVTQRDEVPTHRKKMAEFILRSLVISTLENEYDAKDEARPTGIDKIIGTLGTTIYGALQPITCNIRDTSVSELTASSKGILEKLGDMETRRLQNVVHLNMLPRHLNWSIIDGNHRKEAMHQVKEYLELVEDEYPKKDSLFTPAEDAGQKHTLPIKKFWRKVRDRTYNNSSVKVELHIGLDEDQERQLFTHLNLHPKIVSPSLAQYFDSDDPIIQFTKQFLNSNDKRFSNLRRFPADRLNISSDWNDDDGSMLLKDAVTISSICMLGKTNPMSGTPKIVIERTKLAERMWSAINSIPNFGTENHRTKTVAAQPVVLKGIANLVKELAPYSRTKNATDLTKLLNALDKGEIDFSHKNKVWQALFLNSDEERSQKYGKEISKYVFVSPHTNLIAGEFQEETKWVRFGSRHNDIYKRISDLIRYQLKLTPRDQHREREKAKRITHEKDLEQRELNAKGLK